jgi:prepilin-type N-terminal cleavage/methylation domain-containing protein
MTCDERQGESRVRENFMHGLVDEVSPASRKLLQRRGFTLIELLLVISIIIILSGLLLPALQKSRGYARTLTCLNNTRQVNLAINSYTSDYEYYPWPVCAPDWSFSYIWLQSMIPTYLSPKKGPAPLSYDASLYMQLCCPEGGWWKSNTGMSLAPSPYIITATPDAWSLGVNGISGYYVSGMPTLETALRPSHVKKPSETACISEHPAKDNNIYFLSALRLYNGAATDYIGPNHGLSTNLGYADMHAGKVHIRELTSGGDNSLAKKIWLKYFETKNR